MTQYYPQALQANEMPKHIPAGRYIAIDEKFYRPRTEILLTHESYGNMGKPLLPFGENVTYQPTPFVKRHLPLNLDQRVNYGTYLFNQLTGY